MSSHWPWYGTDPRAMKTEKVHLTKEKETLLPTLYGRALDSRSANPILGDTFADEAVRRLDYDFAKLDLPRGASISLPVRAKHLDLWTREGNWNRRPLGRRP